MTNIQIRGLMNVHNKKVRARVELEHHRECELQTKR